MSLQDALLSGWTSGLFHIMSCVGGRMEMKNKNVEWVHKTKTGGGPQKNYAQSQGGDGEK